MSTFDYRKKGELKFGEEALEVDTCRLFKHWAGLCFVGTWEESMLKMNVQTRKNETVAKSSHKLLILVQWPTRRWWSEAYENWPSIHKLSHRQRKASWAFKDVFFYLQSFNFQSLFHFVILTRYRIFNSFHILVSLSTRSRIQTRKQKQVLYGSRNLVHWIRILTRDMIPGTYKTTDNHAMDEKESSGDKHQYLSKH